MTIGLPLIGAAPLNAHLGHIGDPKDIQNCHHIRLSDTITLSFITTDDINLETGGSIWHAGFALAKYLIENSWIVRDKDVVEIGAGCGLAGITAAALGARSVTLTDIKSQQSHLQRNIEINQPSYEGLCRFVSKAVLHFGDQALDYESSSTVINNADDPFLQTAGANITGKETGVHITGVDNLSSPEGLQDFDVILGADIGYDLSLHEPIGTTLISLLHRERKKNETPNCADFGSLNLHVPRIALLVEEIRWNDIHDWYISSVLDAVYGRKIIYSDDINNNNDDDYDDDDDDNNNDNNNNDYNDNDDETNDNKNEININQKEKVYFVSHHNDLFLLNKPVENRDDLGTSYDSNIAHKKQIFSNNKNSIHLLTLSTEKKIFPPNFKKNQI